LGEITIRLRYNVQTGKKDIFVGYESEEDLAGYEHETYHREILQEIFGKGILQSDEAGELVVERVRPGQQAPSSSPTLTDGEQTPQKN
jgi:hypothetical protein